MAVYRTLLYFGKPSCSSRVSQLPFGLYSKRRYGTTVAEALATQFVQENTSIPVPTILDILIDSNTEVFLLMTSVAGRPLGDVGHLKKASKLQRAMFAETMRGWLEQLRALPPPPGSVISGILGTPLFSYRLDFDDRLGPFESQDVFHAQYFCTLPPEADPDLSSLASRIREKRYRLCFTHGDLNPSNIFVDDSFKPTALIDWECAAWMPEYWELTVTLWRRQRYAEWVEAFSRALPQYSDELAVEMELWKTACPI